MDVVPEIVEALNEQHGYTIRIAAEPEQDVRVRNVRAVSGRDSGAVAIEAGADIACTAVGVNVGVNRGRAGRCWSFACGSARTAL